MEQRMKHLNFLEILLASMAVAACSTEPTIPGADSSDVGYVRISLGQEDISVTTKAPEEIQLPELDDFEVEIYNAKAIRLYRQPYSTAKTDLIRLNAGEFRLVAHHGDTLGAGFGKAYYLASQPFTVHGYVDNGEQYDQVSAVARLANVRMKVEFGENFPKFYSDYWAVVRHSSYAKKQVKFLKTETREGYIPAGDLYLEVYAQLSGSGAQDGGEDHVVYYKSAPVTYEPGDAVTFHVNTGARTADLNVTVSVDRGVETTQYDEQVPSSALPSQKPFFSHEGDTEGSYTYEYPAGLASVAKDAVLSMDVSPKTSFASVLLSCESSVISFDELDLMQATQEQKAALEAFGISWMVPGSYHIGFIDFSRAVKYVSDNAPFSAGSPESAKFTVKVTDALGQTAEGSFTLKATSVEASFTVADVNIWGWKLVAPKAHIEGVEALPADVVIGCQWSADGVAWSAEIPSVAVNGLDVTFADVTGLPAGSDVRLRTILTHNAGNVSSPTVIRTEEPEQVGNNGFEQYTQQTSVTPVAILSDFNVTWWQLYADASDKWWAVNSLTRIPSGSVATGYQDFKSYPSVALTSSGAYSGNSAMVATIFIGSAASRLAAGSAALGELFIGTANDEQGDSWAKTSEGHSFGSRPASLAFQHKFTRGGSVKPFEVSLQVLAADGSVIGTGALSRSDAAGSWTKLTVPVTYTVTDKKAGSIRMSFKSSSDGGENYQALTGTEVNTLSGDHTIHVGNILYLDNIELLYE